MVRDLHVVGCDEHKKMDLFDWSRELLWFPEQLILIDTLSLSCIGYQLTLTHSPLSHQLLSSLVRDLQPLLSLLSAYI